MARCLQQVFLLSIAISLNYSSIAQQGGYVGLSFTIENSSNNFRPGLGTCFEKHVTKHSGFETGLYYRTFVQEGYLTVQNTSGSVSYPFAVSERYLSLPFLYKFYSRIINISAGPSFDFYTGWKQRNKINELIVNSYSIDPNLSIGVLAKLSKSIQLSKEFFIEPEFRVNPLISNPRTYVGFAISGKYKLSRK